jgi:hypothetical protein
VNFNFLDLNLQSFPRCLARSAIAVRYVGTLIESGVNTADAAENRRTTRSGLGDLISR